MKSSLKKKFNILLIKPRLKVYHFTTQPELSRLMGKKDQLPSYAFALLAAMTPDHYSIRIVDEIVEKVPLDYPADIVGFTTTTSTINRTYELADYFMKNGVTVVMGGPYATYCVEEVLTHAHSVIKGEAEGLWQMFLQDFENGSLQKTYEHDSFISFSTNYLPRWEYSRVDKYLCLPVQASRGCPFGCEFCLSTKMLGTRVRLRSIDNIIEEVQSLPVKRLFFVDDNLTINKTFARELMMRLKPLNVSWICQSSIEIAKDAELLRMMAEAGCDTILIGFESLNTESLAETHKFQNIDVDYIEAIRNIHRVGIHVLVSMVIGFDNDTVDDIDRIHEFTRAAGAPYVNLNMLSDSPGSDLYHRMIKENRHLNIPVEYHGGPYPYLKYRRMTLTELLDRYMDVTLRMFSYSTIIEKAKSLFADGGFIRRKKDTDITTGRKFILTTGLFLRHLFTADRDKRRLLFYMLHSVRSRKVAMERACMFLISTEGFNRDIKRWYARKEIYMSMYRGLGEQPENDTLQQPSYAVAGDPGEKIKNRCSPAALSD